MDAELFGDLTKSDPPDAVVDKALAELKTRILELAQQVHDSSRERIYGECRGMLRAFFLTQWVDGGSQFEWNKLIENANYESRQRKAHPQQ